MAGLEGKVALITGAGGMRGVGRAAVLKLAGLGADIALTDVHRETEDLPPAEVRNSWRGIDAVKEEAEAAGVRAFPTYCDLGDSAQIERMVDQVMAHYGRIDILVNNARAIIGTGQGARYGTGAGGLGALPPHQHHRSVPADERSGPPDD